MVTRSIRGVLKFDNPAIYQRDKTAIYQITTLFICKAPKATAAKKLFICNRP